MHSSKLSRTALPVTNSRAKGDIELAFQQLLDIMKSQRGTE